MNKLINNFFLTGEKCMPELRLKQPKFTYSTCVPFTKNRERIQIFRETGILRQSYRNDKDWQRLICCWCSIFK